MNLPILPMQGPRRVSSLTSGSDDVSVLRNFSKFSGKRFSSEISSTSPERSLIVPELSSNPGYSFPGLPNLSNFIFFSKSILLYDFSGIILTFQKNSRSCYIYS